MPENEEIPENQESGPITILHLLSVIAFCMPASATLEELHRSGGGILRYLVAVPSALILGALIVLLVWKIGWAIFSRSRDSATWKQNSAAIVVSALHVISIGVGDSSGIMLAAFVSKHVAK